MYCNKGVPGIRKYAHFPRFLETRRGFLTEKEKMYCNKRVFDSPLLLLLLLCNEPPPLLRFQIDPQGPSTQFCAHKTSTKSTFWQKTTIENLDISQSEGNVLQIRLKIVLEML